MKRQITTFFLMVSFVLVGLISSNDLVKSEADYKLRKSSSINIMDSNNQTSSKDVLDTTDMKEVVGDYENLYLKINNINQAYLANTTDSNDDYSKLDNSIFEKEYSSTPVEEINYRNEYLYYLAKADKILDYRANMKIETYNLKDDFLSVNVNRNIILTVDVSDKDKNIYPENTSELNDSAYETYIFQKINGEWILKKVILELVGLKNEDMIALDTTNNIKEYISKEYYTYNQKAVDDIKKSVKNDKASKLTDFSSDIEDITTTENSKYNFLNELNMYNLFNLITHWKDYSKADALAYALKYWANYNTDFMNFDGMGGDCTNFVSQCINAGGLAMNDNWYHHSLSSYSKTWIHSEYLRDYLINSGIAKGYWKQPPSYPNGKGIEGTIIQASNGSNWFHSAIVRSGTNTENVRVVQHSPSYNDRRWPYHPDGTRYFRIF